MVRFLCALMIALLTLPASARDTTTSAVYLTSLPTGADVWIDGTYVGRTPLLVDALSIGRHSVTAAKTGWENYERDLSVADRPPFAFVDFQLQRGARAPRGTGRLVLRSQARIDDLTVDGFPVKLGPGAFLDLTPGTHEIAIKTPRGRLVRRVAIYAETLTNVVIRAGSDEDDRTSVIAPASRFLPASNFSVDRRRVTVRHNGHLATGNLGEPSMRVDGSPVTFDSVPTMIDGKLFLPLDLFVRVGAAPPESR